LVRLEMLPSDRHEAVSVFAGVDKSSLGSLRNTYDVLKSIIRNKREKDQPMVTVPTQSRDLGVSSYLHIRGVWDGKFM
jgi:hypothetical protein